MTVTAIPWTNFRKNMKSFMQQVCDDAVALTVTQRDGHNIVIMSEQEYNSWRETMHLLSSPRNAARLMKSVENIEKGLYTQRDLLEVDDE